MRSSNAPAHIPFHHRFHIFPCTRRPVWRICTRRSHRCHTLRGRRTNRTAIVPISNCSLLVPFPPLLDTQFHSYSQFHFHFHNHSSRHNNRHLLPLHHDSAVPNFSCHHGSAETGAAHQYPSALRLPTIPSVDAMESSSERRYPKTAAWPSLAAETRDATGHQLSADVERIQKLPN